MPVCHCLFVVNSAASAILSKYSHSHTWADTVSNWICKCVLSCFPHILSPHSTSHILLSLMPPLLLPQREPVLLNELKNLKVAMRVFQWRAQVWFPSNYVVSRTFQGESELIPTVLASSPTCITTPRTDPNHPVYLLEKQVCGFKYLHGCLDHLVPLA